jgi:hypothetical protein
LTYNGRLGYNSQVGIAVAPEHVLVGWEGTTMIDTVTNKPLRVSTDGTAGPYIMVPLDQLDNVRRLLDARRIPYSVDEDAISLNGEPYVTVVDLGRAADAAAVQTILDDAS